MGSLTTEPYAPQQRSGVDIWEVEDLTLPRGARPAVPLPAHSGGKRDFPGTPWRQHTVEGGAAQALQTAPGPDNVSKDAELDP